MIFVHILTFLLIIWGLTHTLIYRKVARNTTPENARLFLKYERRILAGLWWSIGSIYTIWHFAGGGWEGNIWGTVFLVATVYSFFDYYRVVVKRIYYWHKTPLISLKNPNATYEQRKGFNYDLIWLRLMTEHPLTYSLLHRYETKIKRKVHSF